MHLFKATDLVEVGATPMPDEAIKVKVVGVDDAYKMVQAGVIRDAKTICAILLYLTIRKNTL